MDFLALGLDVGIAVTSAVLGFAAAKMLAPPPAEDQPQQQPAAVATTAPKTSPSRPYASTMEERRGLALGAIYIEAKLQPLLQRQRDSNAAPTHDPIKTFELLGPEHWTAADVAGFRVALDRDWSIVDAESCMTVIFYLLDEGGRGEFSYWSSVLARHHLLDGAEDDIAALAGDLDKQRPKPEGAEPALSTRDRLLLASQSWRRLHPAGTAAWDYARLVAVIVCSCAAGYIENGQAWALICGIEARSHRLFRSWTQFADSFLTGSYLEVGERVADVEQAAERLQKNPLAPWQRLAWDYGGPGKPKPAME
jgi:Protein of unknown function (DUF1266)